jgi:hypothetical protein
MINLVNGYHNCRRKPMSKTKIECKDIPSPTKEQDRKIRGIFLKLDKEFFAWYRKWKNYIPKDGNHE